MARATTPSSTKRDAEVSDYELKREKKTLRQHFEVFKNRNTEADHNPLVMHRLQGHAGEQEAPLEGSHFDPGEAAVYVPTGETVTVLLVHTEDPEGVYYTVRMEDGREKQTIPKKLQAQGNHL